MLLGHQFVYMIALGRQVELLAINEFSAWATGSLDLLAKDKRAFEIDLLDSIIVMTAESFEFPYSYGNA